MNKYCFTISVDYPHFWPTFWRKLKDQVINNNNNNNNNNNDNNEFIERYF